MYSLIPLNGDVHSYLKLVRDRKIDINELLSFMENINLMPYSMSENHSEIHTFDNPTDLPCTLTQNVQNTNKAISLLK